MLSELHGELVRAGGAAHGAGLALETCRIDLIIVVGPGDRDLDSPCARLGLKDGFEPACRGSRLVFFLKGDADPAGFQRRGQIVSKRFASCLPRLGAVGKIVDEHGAETGLVRQG